eukprot:TRINITY_DN22774_c0_g1_i1.p1 TRINITY_DN22774_c0_g1~~TRINITY_DN22774_c0_g1_i1.p1  ORF type:complete len:272 (+),score=84.52 TRINITY_DN22774_c0_g1_i1:76-816(+)
MALPLYVRLKEQLIPVEVAPSATVADVRNELSAASGIASGLLRLRFGGDELDPGALLADLGIGAEATLEAMEESQFQWDPVCKGPCIRLDQDCAWICSSTGAGSSCILTTKGFSRGHVCWRIRVLELPGMPYLRMGVALGSLQACQLESTWNIKGTWLIRFGSGNLDTSVNGQQASGNITLPKKEVRDMEYSFRLDCDQGTLQMRIDGAPVDLDPVFPNLPSGEELRPLVGFCSVPGRLRIEGCSW